MADPSARTTAPRRGVLRLVVLALTLAGFVVMHGLAAAATDGAHCGSPAALLLTDDVHGTVNQPVAHHDTALVEEHRTRADAPTPWRESDEVVVGCVLALLGTLVAIGLRLFGVSTAVPASTSARQAPASLRTARGPPTPLFLSLCVFRL